MLCFPQEAEVSITVREGEGEGVVERGRETRREGES